MSLQSDSDREIRRLKDDLYLAREAIIHLMSGDMQEILRSHYKCKTFSEFMAWETAAAEQIIDHADAKPAPTYNGYPIDQPRAACPLCREGPQTPYHQGFAIPTGLERHLLGTHRAQPCTVFGAALAIGRERIRNEDRLSRP